MAKTPKTRLVGVKASVRKVKVPGGIKLVTVKPHLTRVGNKKSK